MEAELFWPCKYKIYGDVRKKEIVRNEIFKQ